MNRVLPSARFQPASLAGLPALAPQTDRQTPTRRYETLYLDTAGQIASLTTVAPATPLFEAAFSAFARGTMIRTDQGPCAIEDLLPGSRIDTVEFGPMPLQWRGTMQLIPNAPVARPEQARLTRIMADSFGFGRPETDLMLGPAAQLLRQGCATPVAQLIDGHCAIQITPPTPVQVFHLCLPHHATILANGLEVSTYHPGNRLGALLGPNMLRLFLTLFPHIQSLDAFGPALHKEAQAELYDLEF